MGEIRTQTQKESYHHRSSPSRNSHRRVKWPRMVLVVFCLLLISCLTTILVTPTQHKLLTLTPAKPLHLSIGPRAQPQWPIILNVPLIHQMAPPELYNGCEVTSLAMILQDAGYQVTKTELADKIPKVPITYENGLKGNPNYGFVGDITGNQPGYFVYHGPIAALARKYAGERVQDLTGDEISKVYQKIDKGIPVWVITTTNFSPAHRQTWKTPHGKVKVSMSEHSVVITGYSEKYIWLNNPYGQKNQRVDRQDFEKSWVEMGRQAVVINPKRNYAKQAL